MKNTDVDYTDDLGLLVSTFIQAESQLYSLEHAAGYIFILVNSDKTLFMCFY